MSAGGARTQPRWLYGLLVAALVAVTLAVPAPEAEASHFRATQVGWHTTTTPNEVEFHLSGSFRCSIFFSPCSSASPGDTFSEYDIAFGDGTSIAYPAVQWSVVSVDPANDVLNAESHQVHEYATAGVYDAVVTGCCRLGRGDGHVNNANDALSISTRVDLTAGRSQSPASQLSPIVDCPVAATCQFSIPATDFDGDTLQWRFPTASDPESNGGSFRQPPGATIDSATGVYSFDTTGVTLAPTGDTFYSTNVIIEAVRNSAVVAQITVDFFIRIGDTTNNPPVFEPPTPADGAVMTATVGSLVEFSTQASDPDAGDTVTLGLLGKPGAATYTTTGANPATGSFSWTPTTTGTTLLTLTAADQQGRQATQRTVRIIVEAASATPGPGGGGGAGGAPERVAPAENPAVEVALSVSPTSRPEPGGTFTFTVAVTNVGQPTVTLTSMTDDDHGDLGDPDNGEVAANTCAGLLGTSLVSGATATCSFDGEFTGAAGDTRTGIVVVVVEAADGTTAEAEDDVTVTLGPAGLVQACPPGQVPPSGFADIGGNTHEAAIECIAWHGVTVGTTATTYAPTLPVRRDQLASLVARLMERSGVKMPEPGDQGFTDIAGNVHADRINQLAELGVVLGTSPATFDPRGPVRRDQAASLLVRAYEFVAGTLPERPSPFTDAAGSVHEAAINKAFDAGFTLGATSTTYSPAAQVRRDQSASFLMRVVDRLVGEGYASPPSR